MDSKSTGTYGLTKMRLDGPINGLFRTRKEQDVVATTRAVLQRLESDSWFGPRLNRYIYATLHHYRPKLAPWDWKDVSKRFLTDLEREPRASFSLEQEPRDARIRLLLNCEDEIVKEKVEGKQRQVPRAGNNSRLSIHARASHFTDSTFAQRFLSLIADLFEIFGGEYGFAEHLYVQHGNDFDLVRGDFFEPQFIRWANFFGPQLVERFGHERLLSAPAYQVRELSTGGVLLIVAASPLQQLDADIQDTIARVKKHLDIQSPSERATPEELERFAARSTARDLEIKQRIEEAFRRAREETTSEMQRQAEGCVEGARQFWNETFDYSPQSLNIVDRIIATKFGAEDEETIVTAVQAFGAYLGEVVRRNLGGDWHDEEMKGQPVLMNVGTEKKRLLPFEVARQRFQSIRKRNDFTLMNWFRTIPQ